MNIESSGSGTVRARLQVRGLLDRAQAQAGRFHVPLSSLLGAVRSKTVNAARFELYLDLCKDGLSFSEIGALFDRTPHAVREVVCGQRGRTSRLAAKYEREALTDGKTVEEFETEYGLPRYSTYPRAQTQDATKRGAFMYRAASEAERSALAREESA